jgi:hypothetical protein
VQACKHTEDGTITRSHGTIQLVTIWKDILGALWFGLVGLTFFAFQWGVALPMGALTAIYSLLLLSSAVSLALSLVGQKGTQNRVE